MIRYVLAPGDQQEAQQLRVYNRVSGPDTLNKMESDRVVLLCYASSILLRMAAT